MGWLGEVYACRLLLVKLTLNCEKDLNVVKI